MSCMLIAMTIFHSIAALALSHNANSTTRSGISGGTLVITDDAAQGAATGKGAEEAIAGVNREAGSGPLFAHDLSLDPLGL